MIKLEAMNESNKKLNMQTNIKVKEDYNRRHSYAQLDWD